MRQRRAIGDLVRLRTAHSFNHAKTGRPAWFKDGTLVSIEDIVFWGETDGCYYVRTLDKLFVGGIFAHEVLDPTEPPLQLLAEQLE